MFSRYNVWYMQSSLQPGSAQDLLDAYMALFAEWWLGPTSANRQGQNAGTKNSLDRRFWMMSPNPGGVGGNITKSLAISRMVVNLGHGQGVCGN
jgi:hypothetical protein